MNVGIIGLGYMGVIHLGAWTRSRGATVKAICSSDPKKLQGDFSSVVGNLPRAQDRIDLNGVERYTDWQDLIKEPELQALDVCLPTEMHAEVVVKALEAGKHVLVEKPMALTLKDCQAMLAAARHNQRVLMVAHVLRFWPEYLRLSSFVKAHSSGPVGTMSFHRECGAPVSKAWIRDDSKSGGALLDLLVHDIDQALHLFGCPASVTAKSNGGVDTVAATLFYDSGVRVDIDGGWFEEGRPFAMSFRAAADKGALSLDTEGVLTHIAPDGISITIKTDGTDAFQSEVDYFVHCCATAEEPTQCPPLDSARAVGLALLLKESRQQGGVQLACTL